MAESDAVIAGTGGQVHMLGIPDDGAVAERETAGLNDNRLGGVEGAAIDGDGVVAGAAHQGRAGAGIGQGIVAATAEEGVGAAAAIERVVPEAAVERIVPVSG